MSERPTVFQTSRSDTWWVYPLLVFLGFSCFIIYATWSGLQGTNYRFGNYISPFYSPELYGEHGWIGTDKPGWFPEWLPWSTAMFVMWIPAGFRFTCYYYRGAYYKAFWLDPPACAVGEPRHGYRGENSFPLIFQ